MTGQDTQGLGNLGEAFTAGEMGAPVNYEQRRVVTWPKCSEVPSVGRGG